MRSAFVCVRAMALALALAVCCGWLFPSHDPVPFASAQTPKQKQKNKTPPKTAPKKPSNVTIVRPPTRAITYRKARRGVRRGIVARHGTNHVRAAMRHLAHARRHVSRAKKVAGANRATIGHTIGIAAQQLRHAASGKR